MARMGDKPIFSPSHPTAPVSNASQNESWRNDFPVSCLRTPKIPIDTGKRSTVSASA